MTTPGDPIPAAELEKEMHPGSNKQFEVDSVSSAVDATNQVKEERREAAEREEEEKQDTLKSLKKATIVSNIAVAVIGAVFAITKKIKEK